MGWPRSEAEFARKGTAFLALKMPGVGVALVAARAPTRGAPTSRIFMVSGCPLGDGHGRLLSKHVEVELTRPRNARKRPALRRNDREFHIISNAYT